MFCRECGKEVKPQSAVCLSCGVRPLDGNKYCQECGVETRVNQEICIKCGMRLLTLYSRQKMGSSKVLPTNPPKSPALAAVLSFLIIGLGQIYVGQVLKGIAFLVATVILGGITFGFGWLIMAIIAPIDAYKIGRKLQNGNPVDIWEFF